MYPSGVAWDYTVTLNPQISPLYQYIRHLSEDSASSGAPDVILHRLPGFIQEFSSSPILPDFLYELEPNLALKFPPVSK